jgi:general secretion pathway protein C
MEKILTKYFWIINLVTLALVAYFLASGTSEFIAAKLEGMLPEAGSTLPKKARTRAPRPPSRFSLSASNGDAILSRNIFDSEIGPISRVEQPEIPPDTEKLVNGDDGLPLVPCTDTSVKIHATVASPEDVEWSFASVEAGGQTRLYRIGDELDSRTVSGITWRYLFLRGTSDECYVDMFGDPNAKPPSRTSTPSTSGPTAGKGSDQYANQITKKSDTEAEIDRSLVNELLADPTKFIRSVRVRPYRQGGKVTGYKLRRFRQDSPLALLGARTGDIIHAVNGVELTSVDKALGAYQNMRNANDLTFQVTRQGKPVELKVSIR